MEPETIKGISVHPNSRKLEFKGEKSIKEVSPTIRSTDYKCPNCVWYEPNVLTPKRTEYGKKVRKAYENGEIQESRHNMTEMQPREDGISNTITTVQKDNLLVEPKIIQVCNILEEKGFINPQRGRVYSAEGISPTINTFQGGGKETKIVTYTRDKKGKVVNRRLVDVANTIHTSTGSGGNTDSFVAEPFNADSEDLCRTIKANYYKMSATNIMDDSEDGSKYKATEAIQNYRIRKLTERECFRLMGVTDADIDKIQSVGISKTQQYKMAGNSIVVDVLYHIFRKMFIDKTTIQLTLF